MEFVLKLFDDILLSFTAHRTLNGTEVHITSFDPSKRARLPLGMEATDSSLERWLRHRTIPANRAYVQNFLSKNGLSENDFIGILSVCKGLSLIDCYWVTTPDDKKTFQQVNRFYRKLLLPAMAVPRFQSFVLLLSLQQTGCFQKPGAG